MKAEAKAKVITHDCAACKTDHYSLSLSLLLRVCLYFYLVLDVFLFLILILATTCCLLPLLVICEFNLSTLSCYVSVFYLLLLLLLLTTTTTAIAIPRRRALKVKSSLTICNLCLSDSNGNRLEEDAKWEAFLISPLLSSLPSSASLSLRFAS